MCNVSTMLHLLGIKMLRKISLFGALREHAFLLPTFTGVQCESLADVEHDVKAVINSTNFAYPNIIHLACNYGYWLPETHRNIFCNSSGQWSPTPAHCKQMMCPEINRTLSWSVRITGYTLGSVANYSCNQGYHINDIMVNQTSEKAEPVQICSNTHNQNHRARLPTGEWLPKLPENLCIIESKLFQ